jgi:5'-nucleotidase
MLNTSATSVNRDEVSVLILVANDDGVYSPGLRTLVLELSKLGNVYVTAPSTERSAAGHALTMRMPIIVQEIEIEGASSAWSIDGTPADCVKLGLEVLLRGQTPDVVVSGINKGPNLGTDVLYSGTVSAAMEGIIEKIPSIAVSLASFSSESDFSTAARFTAKLVMKLLDSQAEAFTQTLLNVNVPALPQSDIKGVRITRLGERRYTNVFDRRVDPRGRTYFWMAGDVQEELEQQDETYDTWAVRNGYISVTPIKLEYTAKDMIELLKKWRLEP